MENAVRINLLVSAGDLEFILNLLNTLRTKATFQYEIQKQNGNTIPGTPISLEGPPLTAEELNRIIEEAEKGPKFSDADFRAKFQL